MTWMILPVRRHRRMAVMCLTCRSNAAGTVTATTASPWPRSSSTASLPVRRHRMMSYYAQSVDMGTVMTFVVGFLGGFSTFSSAINEVLSLIRKRRFAMALGYGAATVAVPLACVALGFGIAMLGGHA